MGLFGDNKELQPGTCNHGKARASLLKQRGSSFIETKKKLRKVITNKVSPVLLCDPGRV